MEQRAITKLRMNYLQDILSYVQVLGSSISYTYLEVEQFTCNQINLEWDAMYFEDFALSDTTKQHSRTVSSVTDVFGYVGGVQ